jgi:hypothetical protein
MKFAVSFELQQDVWKRVDDEGTKWRENKWVSFVDLTIHPQPD